MTKETKAEPSKLEQAIVANAHWELLAEWHGWARTSQLRARITQAMAECAKRFDDDRTLLFFRYLCAHIDDTGHTITAKPASSERAFTAMETWKVLPDFRPDSVMQLYTENDYERVDVKVPTLIATKRALLDEVAARWAGCGEDENGEADTLFRFLMEAKPFERFPSGESEEPMALKAVGKACDQARPSRILEALAILPRPEPGEYGGWRGHIDSHGEMRRKLVINLARQHPNFVTRAALSWERLSDTKSAQRADEAERSVRAASRHG